MCLKYVSSLQLIRNELEYLNIVNKFLVGRTVWYVVSGFGVFDGWNVRSLQLWWMEVAVEGFRPLFYSACDMGNVCDLLIPCCLPSLVYVRCLLTKCWVDSRTCFHIRRHAKHQQNQGNNILGTGSPIPTLPSTYSVHDFHSYGYHGTGVTPGLHFHLAASINAETGELCEGDTKSVLSVATF